MWRVSFALIIALSGCGEKGVSDDQVFTLYQNAPSDPHARMGITEGSCLGLEARRDIFDYIELFYSPKRRHEHADGVSPVEFENQFLLGSRVSTRLGAIHTDTQRGPRFSLEIPKFNLAVIKKCMSSLFSYA